jgi:MFS family permease
LPLLIIIRLLNGFAYGIVSTTAATIIAQIVPVSRQGEGISCYSLSSILAMAGGPFLAILLVQYTDYKIIFLCNVILAAIGLVLSFTDIQVVQATSKHLQEGTAKRFNITNYFEFKVIPIGSIAIIIALVYSSVLTFLSLYAVQLHLEKASSYFFLICAIIVLLSRPFSGRLFDAKGANIVLYPSLFILAICMFLYAQVNNGIALLLYGVLFGLGWGNFQSCAQALAVKLTPPHRYGIGTATYFSMYEIGVGTGPYFCGYLVQFMGLRYLYLIMGVVTIAAIILYYFLQGERGVN